MDGPGPLTLDEFLDRLAAREPVPGGGAAAGVTGAIASALASMVVAYSRGRKASAACEPALEEIGEKLLALRARMLALAAEDARAYARLSGLWKLAKDDPRRGVEMPGALREAIAAPTGIMDAARELLGLCEQLAPVANPNLLSDLAGAAALAEACVRSAGQNVRVNAAMIPDEAERALLIDDLWSRRGETMLRREAIERACGS